MKVRFNDNFNKNRQAQSHDKSNDVEEPYLLVVGFSAVEVG
jgi:hypothetical protein